MSYNVDKNDIMSAQSMNYKRENNDQQKIRCPICLQLYYPNQLKSINNCNHYFCTQCLVTKILQSLDWNEQIRCPIDQCQIRLSQGTQMWKSLSFDTQNRIIKLRKRLQLQNQVPYHRNSYRFSQKLYDNFQYSKPIVYLKKQLQQQLLLQPVKKHQMGQINQSINQLQNNIYQPFIRNSYQQRAKQVIEQRVNKHLTIQQRFIRILLFPILFMIGAPFIIILFFLILILGLVFGFLFIIGYLSLGILIVCIIILQQGQFDFVEFLILAILVIVSGILYLIAKAIEKKGFNLVLKLINFTVSIFQKIMTFPCPQKRSSN